MKLRNISVSVAQGIEQRFPKPCAGGSNPLRDTTIRTMCGFSIVEDSHLRFPSSRTCFASESSQGHHYPHDVRFFLQQKRSGNDPGRFFVTYFSIKFIFSPIIIAFESWPCPISLVTTTGRLSSICIFSRSKTVISGFDFSYFVNVPRSTPTT